MSSSKAPVIGWLAITAALVGGLASGAEPEAAGVPKDIIELTCDKPLKI